MVAYQTTRTAPAATLAAPHPTFSFGAFIAALQKWNDRRITRKELSRLSNRELEDIGLTRGDIDAL